jgi:hypothetical protein
MFPRRFQTDPLPAQVVESRPIFEIRLGSRGVTMLNRQNQRTMIRFGFGEGPGEEPAAGATSLPNCSGCHLLLQAGVEITKRKFVGMHQIYPLLRIALVGDGTGVLLPLARDVWRDVPGNQIVRGQPEVHL